MRKTLSVILGLLSIIAIGTASYVGRLAYRIRAQAVIDEARPADVIVILGAAAYRGRPSPILKARLDHGLDLYRRQLAPLIVTTGGAGGDPDYTESGTGRAYLMSHGVPSEAIMLEPEGDSTIYSTSAVAEIMKRMNLNTCIVVSDGYHIYRAKKLLESKGLTVYGSPRPSARADGWTLWKLCFRQAVGHTLWLVGIGI